MRQNTNTNPISIKIQNDIISNANAAVVRFAYEHAAKKGMKMLLSKEELEDIAGDTIYKACHYFDRYDPDKGAISTWVGKIAANCVISAFEYKCKHLPISQALILKNRDQEEFLVDEACCSDRGVNPEMKNLFSEYEADRELHRKEFMEVIKTKASRLSKKDQHFLKMLEEGLGPKEMALIAGCSPDAAGKRIWSIRRALRCSVGEMAGEFGFNFMKDAG